MGTLLGLVVIVALSYLGSVYIFSKEKLPTPLRYLFFSGWEFILLGMALGPLALNLFPLKTIEQLDPIIHLGLGWVGLFIGLQLRGKDLFRQHPLHLTVTFLQSLFTGFLVAAAVWPFIDRFFPRQPHLVLTAVIILAASAALSSPTILILLRRETGFKDRVIGLLNLITNLDMVVSILAVGVAFTLLRPGTAIEDGFLLLVQSVLAGFLLAYLFYIMPREKLSANETLVVLFGFVLFSSGVGSVLQVSPLFLNLVCGIFLANTLPKNDPFYAAIINLEKPLYIVMLIISGLLFTLPGRDAALLALVIIVVRLAAKYFFISFAAPKIDPYLKFPPNTGLALASQGAMALVIGFPFLTAYPGAAARTIFSIIIICVMANEIIAPYLVSRVFRKTE